MKNKYIDVLVKEPKSVFELRKVENKLSELQKLVGGYIEVVSYNGYVVLADEEGKLKGDESNLRIGGRDIVGTIVVLSMSNGNFRSIKAKDLVEFINDFNNGTIRGWHESK